ncbi:MAG: hypothetical protein HY074_08065 [Deltaproteobacteria bacterium]|nr:hypothetical protein [Deltaproteobacteria bacterium]
MKDYIISISLPKIPPLRDARYLQIAILAVYSFIAREYYGLERPHAVAVGCVFLAVALDCIVGIAVYRKIVFPLSAVIIGLSASILIDAQYWENYLIVTAIASLSKAFFVHQGRHYFNPTCFGVACALLFLPYSTSGIPDLFSGYLWPSVAFGLLGLLTVVYARQTVVALSWYFTFLLLAPLRAWLTGASAWFTVGPAVGSAILLFTFHMISDPGTTPRSRRWQIVFGVSVGALDAVLRYYQVPHGQFYALAGVGSLLPWIRDVDLPAGTR